MQRQYRCGAEGEDQGELLDQLLRMPQSWLETPEVQESRLWSSGCIFLHAVTFPVHQLITAKEMGFFTIGAYFRIIYPFRCKYWNYNCKRCLTINSTGQDVILTGYPVGRNGIGYPARFLAFIFHELFFLKKQDICLMTIFNISIFIIIFTYSISGRKTDMKRPDTLAMSGRLPCCLSVPIQYNMLR